MMFVGIVLYSPGSGFSQTVIKQLTLCHGRIIVNQFSDLRNVEFEVGVSSALPCQSLEFLTFLRT